jgi:putative AdoMet-dependent methyltransferase
MQHDKDYFAQKAGEYDSERERVQNVKNIANTILKEVHFSKDMHIMDFGSGTGLLLTQIAPHVGKITAVDISSSMNAVLQTKLNDLPCSVDIQEIDLMEEKPLCHFDAIISSMTFHHIEDPEALFRRLCDLLDKDGVIAIADIDKEDGSFHTEDTGVYHLGFDRDEFLKLAQKAGFKDLKMQTASVVKKPHGEYPVFLLSGKK